MSQHIEGQARERERESVRNTRKKKAHSELNELERKINSTQPTEKETTRSRLARQSTNVNQNNMHWISTLCVRELA